jgi:hypothetical protein
MPGISGETNIFLIGSSIITAAADWFSDTKEGSYVGKNCHHCSF